MVPDTFECNMLKIAERMGLGHTYCSNCELFQKAKVCQSAAGFYIGVYDEGSPYCRLTSYSATKEDAEKVLSTTRKTNESI